MSTKQQPRLNLKRTKSLTSTKPQVVQSPSKKQKQLQRSPSPPVPSWREILNKFDASSKFGPRFDISRKDRYTRAVKMGVVVPSELEQILEKHPEEAEFVWTLEALMQKASRE